MFLSLPCFLFARVDVAPAAPGTMLVDATGFEIDLARPPERVISLNPDLTENVIALGAGNRLVGVSDFCPLPPEFSRITRLGGLQSPGLEGIVALKPDLVLATREGNSPETVARLRGLGIKVFVFPEATDFAAYFSFLKELGAILGREAAAAGRIEETKRLIERVRVRTSGSKPVSVFVQVGARPLITASRSTLIGEMIEIAGGENIAAALTPRYPVISREQVLQADPAVIIIAVMGNEAADARSGWEKFPELQAVRTGRIAVLDPDTVCHLGPRLDEGLEELARVIAGEGVGNE